MHCRRSLLEAEFSSAGLRASVTASSSSGRQAVVFCGRWRVTSAYDDGGNTCDAAGSLPALRVGGGVASQSASQWASQPASQPV